MAKKRTRKQKETAKHIFTVRWDPEAEKDSSEADVKGQITQLSNTKILNSRKADLPELLVKEESLIEIKRDIRKSVLLATLIIGFEIVLYLVWNK